jgi:uncharacterized membrane protein YdjX (TVP38/TMEM64 family)
MICLPSNLFLSQTVASGEAVHCQPTPRRFGFSKASFLMNSVAKVNGAPPIDESCLLKTSPSGRAAQRQLLRLIVGLGLLLVMGAGYVLLGDRLNLENLARYESSFRQFQGDHPWLVYALAFAAYVAVAGLSLPGAAAMTLLMGWMFGMVRGVVVVSFASTAGASLAFLLSRYLLRESLQQQFGDRLTAFNTALEREGAFYLFSLRLIPAVPFFVINVVIGLTPLRLSTFWWVSQLGMLPGTAAYVYAGSTVPGLEQLSQQGLRGIVSPELVAAFALLGVLPLAAKWTLARLSRKPTPSA